MQSSNRLVPAAIELDTPTVATTLVEFKATSGGTTHGAGKDITLISTDGTTRMYRGSTLAFFDGEVISGTGNSTIIAFRSNYNLANTKAHGFAAAVNHANGHNGKITANNVNAVTSLTQVTAGSDGNTVVTSGASLTTIVTSNPNNFTGGSGGLTQADHHYAVKIEMSRPGGKGNTTVVYGATGSADLYSHTHQTFPIMGLPPIEADSSQGTNWYRLFNTEAFNHYMSFPAHTEMTGTNAAWYHPGAASESFHGGGLRLVGWWKCNGPALNPDEPRVNVISNTVPSNSMMERPAHRIFESAHHSLKPALKENAASGDVVDQFNNPTPPQRNAHISANYIRTNPALNVGGTWTSDYPRAE